MLKDLNIGAVGDGLKLETKPSKFSEVTFILKKIIILDDGIYDKLQIY